MSPTPNTSPKPPGSAGADGGPAKGAFESEHAGRVKLGKYRFLKKLGSGGMGAVFQAEDTERNRIVAIKILPKDKAKNPTLVKRFKAEAQAAVNLSHDNIVQVFGAGEADGYLYISMEFVEGTDVQELVTKHGVLPVKRSLDIIRQMARALDHTGSMNLAHRDIKPSNLLIRPDGLIKLTDLGLARFIDEETETGITRAGYTVGTIDYMAPEQARDSKSADVRSDIYSLGCSWYFMLTGQPPFPEGSVTNKITAHAMTPVPDPRKLNPEIPEAIVTVIQRMLEKDPDERYQTGRELLADLRTVANSRDRTASRLRHALGDEDVLPARSRRKPRRDKDSATRQASPKKNKRGAKPARNSQGGIQIQVDPLRFVAAALLLIVVLGGFWWISRSLGEVSTVPTPESKKSLDSSDRPSAPDIRPTP